MGQKDLQQPLIPATRVTPITGGGTLAAPVHGQYRRLSIRRGKKGTGFVSEVMFDEQPALQYMCDGVGSEPLLQMQRHAVDELSRGIHDVRQKETVPGRPGPAPVCRRLQRQLDTALWRDRVGKQRGIERIGNMIDVFEIAIRLAQYMIDCVIRQLPRGKRYGPLAMLDAREAFFFHSRHDAPIAYQRSRTIMKRGVDSQCEHSTSPSAWAGRGSPGRGF